VAHICHEANRLYCLLVMGDDSQPEFDFAPDWQIESAENGVHAIMEGRVDGPRASHESWMKEKVEAGWIYGPEKNPDAVPPTHHCLVPYDELPELQRRKDHLFTAIVKALTEPID
jgi:hypothetical protein